MSKVEIIRGDYLGTLKNCGGYYECPRDQNGKALGPLVGYAAEYAPGKHYVGYVYANFAKAENFPQVLNYFAIELQDCLGGLLRSVDVFCGMPMGGIAPGLMLAYVCQRRYVYLEKKVTALKTIGAREQSELILKRHEINPGDKVIIVEDVANNFSTTDKAIEVIRQAKGRVIAIACLLNRSLKIDDKYTTALSSEVLHVISLVRMPIPQFKQDDLEVAGEVKSGNVVWKPKDEWDKLMQAMDSIIQ